MKVDDPVIVYKWPWTNPKSGIINKIFEYNNKPGKEPVSYIKVHAGFSIWLPVERLFLSEEECRSDLRNKLLKEILNEQFI